MRGLSPQLDQRGSTLWPPEAEAAYREHFLRDDARLSATFLAMATFAHAIFAVNDARFAASPTVLAWVILARALFVGFGVVASWRIWGALRPSVLDGWVMAWAVAYALRGIPFQSIRPPDHFLPFLGDLLVSVFFWLVIPVPLRVQARAFAVITLGTFGWLLAFRSRPPPEGWSLIVGAWVFGNATGAFGSWRAQRLRRREFVSGLRLAEAEGVARARGEALAASEGQYRTLLDHIQIGVVVHGSDGKVILANARASELLGVPAEALPGLAAATPDWRFLRSDETAMPAGERPASQVLATGLAVRHQIVGIVRPGDGPRAWVVADAYPGRDRDGRLEQVVVTLTDVTEVRALQSRLALASRLASMGTLVAGVSHEISNPLAGAKASLRFVAEEVEGLHAILESRAPLYRAAIARHLDLIREAIGDAEAGEERIGAIARDLAQLAHPNPPRERVQLARVVEVALRWVPSAIRRAATIDVEDRGGPEVVASEGQLSQVIVNLVVNAIKAARPGEPVTIRIVVEPGGPGIARIDVKDDGVGMPPEVLDRIFDPFFTTREPGRGTGLGLSISQAIVTAHGGTLSATSEPGKGSTFRVELPGEGACTARP